MYYRGAGAAIVVYDVTNRVRCGSAPLVLARSVVMAALQQHAVVVLMRHTRRSRGPCVATTMAGCPYAGVGMRVCRSLSTVPSRG
jgi:hypothetical protein